VHEAILIALSAPISRADDDAFNCWYDKVHLPEVVSLPGVVSARRYRTAAVKPLDGIAGATHPYVAIYEPEATSEADLQALMDTMAAAMLAGRFDMAGPIDMSNVGAILATPIGTKLCAVQSGPSLD
jgi:hypothetical protein